MIGHQYSILVGGSSVIGQCSAADCFHISLYNCHDVQLSKMQTNLVIFLIILSNRAISAYEDAEFWVKDAQTRLEKKISAPIIQGEAKNVIFFLGDGLSVTTIAAARILKGQKVDNLPYGEEAELHIDSFPFTGTSKTFCVDAQVADSACSVTAYLGGTKANYGTIGLTPAVTRKICEGQLNTANHVASLVALAQAAGKSTGIITTTRITDASPAGTYGHVVERDWENDAAVRNDGQDSELCDDLAEQLILREPGKSINVILGAGRRNFLNESQRDPEYPTVTGARTDGKDLIAEWQSTKNPSNSKYVNTKEELLTVDTVSTEFLFGLFESGDRGYVDELEAQKDPSLPDMLRVGLEILKKNPNGYFLFVEGGLIDNAHHGNLVQRALFETIEFDAAIKLGDDLTNDSDTLIVVTADHSHVLSFTGHSSRGHSILEVTDQYIETNDDLPYLTLTYANGPGVWLNETGGGRRNVSGDNFHALNYSVPAPVPRNSETHAGEDVLIYAKGPFAHLLSGTHQQSYIPHVVRYAACLGSGVKYCDNLPTVPTDPTDPTTTKGSATSFISNGKLSLAAIVLLLSIHL